MKPNIPTHLSEPMKRAYEMLARAARSSINVLILGETGVGKEVLTEELHRLSPRAAHPLVAINCAGLSESLLESELFGYERGAFTGAVQAKPGLLETAQGGTIFLDEIGEMSPTMQAKLLRVIETREVLPVGGLKPRPIDVRFVAATNRNLDEETEKKTFRHDLFFRLNPMTIEVPPLRERRSEILELARTFVAQAADGLGRPAPAISAPAEALLEQYRWPGNVRELKNVMERAVVLCDGPEIRLEHLPVERFRGAPANGAPPRPDERAPGGRALTAEEQDEKRRMEDALAVTVQNQTAAAKLLKMSRRSFISKMERYGIPRPHKV